MERPRLAAVTEIASVLGVSRQQAHRLASRPGFPEPVAVLSVGRIWLLDDVEAWARSSRRPPGRPETPKPGS